jgi:hypothetical protein
MNHAARSLRSPLFRPRRVPARRYEPDPQEQLAELAEDMEANPTAPSCAEEPCV